MYDRNRGQQSIASFITNNHDIKEETDEETDTMADELHKKLRRDSDVIISIDFFKFFQFSKFPFIVSSTEFPYANSE